MVNVGQLQRQYVDFVTSLYREGFLDDQFVQLQKLQDASNPYFVVEVVSLYFEDSEKLMNNLATALQQHVVDFKQIDAHVHQFKGSSSRCAKSEEYVCCLQRLLRGEEPGWVILLGCLTLGKLMLHHAPRLDEIHVPKCLKCLQQVKHEYCIVKNKLETMIRLERQISEAGGTIPVIP